MKCASPFYVAKPTLGDPDASFAVPCGKCLACKIQRSNEWALRIMHELHDHEKACFITLTYDDEHLPRTNSLDKTALTNFFKRLRKYWTDDYRLKTQRLKYYACGEYGELSGRPHYHAIILGMSAEDFRLASFDSVKKEYFHLGFGLWESGLVHVGEVTYDSARYVAGYVHKKYTKDKNKEVYEDRGLVPPFQRSSQGFGLKFALDNSETLKQDLFTWNRGHQVGLPRYYKKKLDIPSEALAEYGKKQIEKVYMTYTDKRKMTDPEKIDKQIERAREQRNRTLEHKLKIAATRSKKI